ncbi:MAG: hypothetical protein IKZ62_01345 [Prevotella sp.]|nr:hypothetical protein [Prevotella sp.]
MKKMMIALVAMLTIAATGKAMSYEQARNEALFLTDKMAYELNLTEEQYEAAYEINLDYLMGVTSYDDVYGIYWERRNLDLSYILLDWQLSAFRAASYFYRPLYWADGFWHFAIYGRYPHRDYFYYGRPVFYASYRGGHAWHVTGHSWYHGRRDHYIHHHTSSHFGMRDGWNRGDYRHHHSGNRMSSTRTTVNHRDRDRNMDRGNRDMNRGSRDNNRNRDMNHGNRDNNRSNHDMNRGPRDNNNRPTTPSTTPSTNNNTPRSLGGHRTNGITSRPSSSSTTRPSSPSRSGGSSSGMRSGGSFSGGHSGGGARSVGGGSHGGGGRSSGGGHSYGGRR